MADESNNNSSSGVWAGRAPIIALILLIVISLVAVGVLGGLLLRSGNDGPAAEPGEPTPFPPAVAGSAGQGEAIISGISDSKTVTVTVNAPVSLDIAGKAFAVQPQTINPDGSWSPGLSGDDSAGWVYGSVINYLFALPPADQNQSLLQSLAPGDPLVVTMQNGAELVFEAEQTQMVAPNSADVFGQLSPGITVLVLESGNDQRLVARGRFARAENVGASSSSQTVNVGEAAQLGDLQLMVTGATYVPNDPNAPSGFAFFVVNLQLANTGPTPIDLGRLRLVLVDETGNQYVLNPVATRLGENAPLTGGFLNAGGSTSVSAGYQVPRGLSSTTVNMAVVQQDTGAQVQVSIPFSGRSAATSTTVSLQSVEVSEDLTTLTMAGQIANNGSEPVIITQEDVTLRTPEGASFLVLSSNPPFPWTIPAGQTLQHTVTFQRPANADAAVFAILNQPFQLTNLR